MLDLKSLQKEMHEWREKNFPEAEAWQQLLGVGEEVGELNHAFLKRSQQIRKTEDHDEGMVDAVGDIFVFLSNFCSMEGIDIEDAITRTWGKVSRRDWIVNPDTPNE